MSATTPNLVKCPDCKKNVSVAALSCPNCGRPFELGELAALIPPPPPPPTPADTATVAAVSTLTMVIMIVGAVVIGALVLMFC